MTPRPRDLAAVFVLLLVLAGVRWAPELAGLTTFGAEDLPVLNEPVRGYFGDWARRGVLVLWTPLLQTGFPLFAESQAGACYPPRALHALGLPHGTVLAWTIVLHLAWAGCGVFAWLTALGLRRDAALIPAVAWTFSALLVVRHQHTNVLEALSWWGWLLAAVETATRTDSRRAWVAAGVAMGLMSACGHPQYVLLGGLVALGYALARARQLRRGGLPRTGWPGLAVAAGLAAPQMLPLLELAGHSIRAAGVGAGEQVSCSFTPVLWPLAVVPGLLGPPFGGRLALGWETAFYLGLLPLLLAGLGLQRGGAPARIALGLIVLGLWAALGDVGGLWWIVRHLPGFEALRVPARMLAVAGLGIVLAAGLGADHVARGRVRWSPAADRWAWLVAGAWLLLGLAAVGLLERREPGLGARALLPVGGGLVMLVLAVLWLRSACALPGGRWLRLGAGLVVVDLMLAGLSWNPSSPPPAVAPPTDLPARVAVPPGREATLAGLRPMSNLARGVANIYNMSPLTLARPVALVDAAHGSPDVAAARARLARLLGVGFELDEQAPVPRLRAASLAPMPRIWSPATVEPLAPALAAERLVAPGFDPWRRAFCERRLELPERLPSAAGAPLETGSPNRSAYRVTAEEQRFWVISETAYPGRRLYLDGRPARLVPANLVQSGALVPAGGHRLVLVHDSAVVRLGRFIGLVTLAALAGLIRWRRRDG